MDSSGFDNHAQQNLGFYKGFMRFIMVSVAVTILTLALMAIFLL